MNFYFLEQRDHHWGGYGQILMHGMTMHRGRNAEGLLQLERTGPYVPEMTFPEALVVSNEMKDALLASGLAGLEFRPVIKAHLVELDWLSWDQSLEDPPTFSENGEPEDYITCNPHSEALAQEMGSLWELVFPKVGVLDDNYAYSTDEPLSSDFFSPTNRGYCLVSSAAAQWVNEHAGEAVHAVPVEDSSAYFHLQEHRKSRLKRDIP